MIAFPDFATLAFDDVAPSGHPTQTIPAEAWLSKSARRCGKCSIRNSQDQSRPTSRSVIWLWGRIALEFGEIAALR